jgi:hypothetical protein
MRRCVTGVLERRAGGAIRRTFALVAAALAFCSEAKAETSAVDDIVALVRDVCIERGANRRAMERLAQERAWRLLSRAELDAIPMRGVRPGFVEGWAVQETGASIIVTISASGVIGPGMRQRAASGERVTAPPPGEAAADATEQDRAYQRLATQNCAVRFSGLSSAEFAEIGRGMSAIEVFGTALGEPTRAADVSRGLPRGHRAFNTFWGVSPTRLNWLAVNYTIHDEQGKMRAEASVNQPSS